MPNVPDLTNEERKSRMLIEKKTVINLLEAYAVHHLPSRHATLFHRTVKDALAVGSTGIHEASTDLDAVEFYKQYAESSICLMNTYPFILGIHAVASPLSHGPFESHRVLG